MSSEHATIRWSGDHWTLKDLGSRNGTFVNGAALATRLVVPLRNGSRLSFGSVTDTWTFIDDTAPGMAAVPCAGGDPITDVNGLLALPSGDHPLVTIYCATNGAWMLDRNDTVEEVADGAIVEVDGQSYRLCAPKPMARTARIDMPQHMDSLRLVFRVSRDEEHIELSVHTRSDRTRLGARGHNYLLLHLARCRLQELSNGVEPALTGWVYQDEVCSALNLEPGRLNVDIYRIRRQFAAIPVVDPVHVVERRPGTKQLRIGTTLLSIEQP